MTDILLVDASNKDMLIAAFLSKGKLIDLYHDSSQSTDTVGNLYLGKVVNVVQSLSAYFVDYGVGKNGFLPFTSCPSGLKRDDLTIIQVVKTEKDNKGAKLSGFIKMSGQYAVFTPYGSPWSRNNDNKNNETKNNENKNENGIENKSANFSDTSKVKHAIQNISYSIIQNDINKLENVWSEVKAMADQAKTPRIIHQEYSLIHRILRDKYNQSKIEIVVDGSDEFVKTQQSVESMLLSHTVKEYKGIIPIFTKFGISDDLKNLNSRIIDLECGGSIVIDLAEAMVCIDINSSSSKQGDLEENSYKVNLEASKEIARHIQLRDLSGIIAIDFIDMSNQQNVAKIEAEFRESMKNDSAFTRISNINEFGVLLMSRQRSNMNLYQHLYLKCNQCMGQGLVKTTQSLAFDIISSIRLSIHSNPGGLIQVECEEKIAQYILNEMRGILFNLEKHGARIQIAINSICYNSFTINPKGEIKSSEIVKFEHPIIEKRKIMFRLMQDIQVSQSYITLMNNGDALIANL